MHSKWLGYFLRFLKMVKRNTYILLAKTVYFLYFPHFSTRSFSSSNFQSSYSNSQLVFTSPIPSSPLSDDHATTVIRPWSHSGHIQVPFKAPSRTLCSQGAASSFHVAKKLTSFSFTGSVLCSFSVCLAP
ncbi:Protein CBG27468 [Caenorhabditis briggsae]|uniref:Protein CBG27468 n=1 Tax=Caenorhabditis briggsae TaxID=6238 RepID=B6IK45_CAEBR|nr:Protein CBG27468 [Caenorhabditis briggsae]CAS00275.1 Protein CBG27468 [Caenorhabditis briggsae]